MPGVLGGLGDDVQEDAAGRTARAGLEPRRLGQLVRRVEIGRLRTSSSVRAATSAYRARTSSSVSSGSSRPVGPGLEAGVVGGYDLERGDWRSFRLDRLSAPSGTGARFAPRRLPAEDAAAFVRDGVDAAVATVTAGARVAAPAAEVGRVIGRWAKVEPDGAQRCRVTGRQRTWIGRCSRSA